MRAGCERGVGGFEGGEAGAQEEEEGDGPASLGPWRL